MYGSRKPIFEEKKRYSCKKREEERIEQILQTYENDLRTAWEQIVQSADTFLWVRFNPALRVFTDPVPVSQILGARFGFSEEEQRQAIDDFPRFFTKRRYKEPKPEYADDLLLDLDEHPFK